MQANLPYETGTLTNYKASALSQLTFILYFAEEVENALYNSNAALMSVIQ